MSYLVQINANLIWCLQGTKGGAVLAICDALDLVLEAVDANEATSLIEEGLEFFFRDHLQEGTLGRFLMQKGWTTSSPLPERLDEGALVRFDVPWTVESNSHAS